MKPDDHPTIVSLESHRRKRLADSRKRPARPPHERAINWRKAPLVIAVFAAFMVISWLLHSAGSLLNPFR